MSSLTLQSLYDSRQVDACREAAVASMASSNEAERDAAALFVIDKLLFDLFEPALAALKPAHARLANDIQACNAIAYAAWFADDIPLCSWAAQRCIALNPAIPNGYLRLGMLELGHEKYRDAFSTLSIGLARCPSSGALRAWHKLAEALARGARNVQFAFDGLQFTFELAMFNGHAMETSAGYVFGHLSEQEELRYVRQFVGSCNCVVEVGAAVGNHTVFFAKALRPKHVHVFDANLRAVEQVRRNAALNELDRNGTQVSVRHAAVGGAPGRIHMLGQDVEVVRLDDAVPDHVDFIKIDVDGMELEVLEGCHQLIARDRPKVMIEVQRGMRERFEAFLRQHDYTIEHEIGRDADTNFFVRPN
jgi:hypothetical protein